MCCNIGSKRLKLLNKLYDVANQRLDEEFKYE